MKKPIILTYIVVGLCNIAIAQITTSNTCAPTTKTEAQQNEICEDGKGITTNPSNPVNTECPLLINSFDWKLKNPISGTLIEELTLYIIQQQKQIDELKATLESLKSE